MNEMAGETNSMLANSGLRFPPLICYSETCKGHLSSVPNFSSHFYCKLSLYSADTSIKWTRILKWGRFVAQNLYWADTSRDFTMDICYIVGRLCSFKIVFSRCNLLHNQIGPYAKLWQGMLNHKLHYLQKLAFFICLWPYLYLQSNFFLGNRHNRAYTRRKSLNTIYL